MLKYSIIFTCAFVQVSDGQYLTYNVALHPHCSITYNKNSWKGQNVKKSPEDIISSYRFPTIKVPVILKEILCSCDFRW